MASRACKWHHGLVNRAPTINSYAPSSCSKGDAAWITTETTTIIWRKTPDICMTCSLPGLSDLLGLPGVLPSLTYGRQAHCLAVISGGFLSWNVFVQQLFLPIVASMCVSWAGC